ncbi:hypothetical protein GCM10027295_34210 [Pseudaeromonas pectinilytica]
MALVRSGNKAQVQEANPAFDKIHKPGEKCDYEGIYKCVGCNKEGLFAN